MNKTSDVLSTILAIVISIVRYLFKYVIIRRQFT